MLRILAKGMTSSIKKYASDKIIFTKLEKHTLQTISLEFSDLIFVKCFTSKISISLEKTPPQEGTTNHCQSSISTDHLIQKLAKHHQEWCNHKRTLDSKMIITTMIVEHYHQFHQNIWSTATIEHHHQWKQLNKIVEHQHQC